MNRGPKSGAVSASHETADIERVLELISRDQHPRYDAKTYRTIELLQHESDEELDELLQHESDEELLQYDHEEEEEEEEESLLSNSMTITSTDDESDDEKENESLNDHE
jgi:hypothetical protein